MERNGISIHEARIYIALRSAAGCWMTNTEIAKAASVANRTARLHTLRLSKLGILDMAEVFPAHRFRYSEKAGKRDPQYLQRLERACEVFGIELPHPAAP